MKPKIAIVGASEHGRVIADIISKTNTHSIVGFIDAQKNKSVDLWGYEILGSEEDLGLIADEYGIEYVVIAIGDNYIRNIVRTKIVKSWSKAKFASCIHPSAIIGHNTKIGNGTVIMAGVIINPNTTIGEHCIINTKTSVDHDNTIGDFASLAPNVTTGGNVKIGDFSAIGLSASIIHGKNIGQHTVIGASSLVVNNFNDQIVAYGVPAKLMRTREKGERYL
jgi:sugar O-acyltransferase (sialic acid O-acetyltransferase NeuD family)